jgi:hypothetical protein
VNLLAGMQVLYIISFVLQILSNVLMILLYLIFVNVFLMFTRHSVLLLKAVFFEDSDSDINTLENTEHIVQIK